MLGSAAGVSTLLMTWYICVRIYRVFSLTIHAIFDALPTIRAIDCEVNIRLLRASYHLQFLTYHSDISDELTELAKLSPERRALRFAESLFLSYLEISRGYL